MKQEEIERHVLEYSQKRPLYERLVEKVKDIVREALDSEGIIYSNIEGRAKAIESFKNKIEKGVTFEPEEMQDLAGIRIICYVNSDIDKITEIIKELFEIDEKRSVDKSNLLGTDKVGYRSMHFVAKLPIERIQLLENKKFEGLHFEIQIRTILQHSWAEIQHGRNYKFSGVLPKEEQRRFALLSGLLEIADNEFDNISKSIEKYSIEVSEKTKAGELNIPINSISLRQYLIDKFGDVPTIEYSFGPNDDASAELIDELKLMEIKTLGELNNIIPPKLREYLLKYMSMDNFCGLLRTILMLYNADEYFKKAWKRKWAGFEAKDIPLFKEYGINIEELIKKYDIDIISETWESEVSE